MWFFLLAACTSSPDDTADTGDLLDSGDTADSGETGDTADSGETGDTGDTGGVPPDWTCHPWFPVDVAGAVWTYRDPEGGQVTWSAAGSFVWMHEKVVRLDIGGATPPVNEYFACSAEGLLLVGVVLPGEAEDVTFRFEPPLLFLPAHPTGGSTWSTVSTLTILGRGEEVHDKIVAEGSLGTFTHVKVPAGAFSALPFALSTGDDMPPLNVGALVEGIGSVQGGGLVLESWRFPEE